MIVAAIVGGLLNAAGIRKTANSQPVGTRRDVARVFAEPLYDLSHGLRLDQPRKAIQAIAGRSGDDDINASLPGPSVTTETTSPSPEPGGTSPPTTLPKRVKKRAFSPTDRLLVWIGGDSLSIVPGQSFANLAPGTEVIDLVGGTVDGHVATGLARPEVFNWSDRLQQVITEDQPDAMVLTLGSNDDQTLTGEGGVGPFGSPEWITEYRRRVGGIMDLVTASGERVLFVMGAPIMRNEERSETRYRIINDIYRDEALKRPGRVHYIDIYDRYRGPDGGYADFIDGVQVRTPDGVHFSRAGGDQVAQLVLDAMHAAFDLTSWRATTSTTTAAGATPPTTAGSTKTSRARRP